VIRAGQRTRSIGAAHGATDQTLIRYGPAGHPPRRSSKTERAAGSAKIRTTVSHPSGLRSLERASAVGALCSTGTELPWKSAAATLSNCLIELSLRARVNER
jgi:hypothetical protein